MVKAPIPINGQNANMTKLSCHPLLMPKANDAIPAAIHCNEIPILSPIPVWILVISLKNVKNLTWPVRNAQSSKAVRFTLSILCLILRLVFHRTNRSSETAPNERKQFAFYDTAFRLLTSKMLSTNNLHKLANDVRNLHFAANLGPTTEYNSDPDINVLERKFLHQSNDTLRKILTSQADNNVVRFVAIAFLSRKTSFYAKKIFQSQWQNTSVLILQRSA